MCVCVESDLEQKGQCVASAVIKSLADVEKVIIFVSLFSSEVTQEDTEGSF